MSRYSALYKEFTDLPIRVSVWEGDVMHGETPFISDGTVLLARAKCDPGRLEKLPPRRDGVSRDAADAAFLWSQAIQFAHRPVYPVWQAWLTGGPDTSLPAHMEKARAYCIERERATADYFDPRERFPDETVSLDALRARLVCWLTEPDAIMAQQDPEKPVVWYRGDLDPVAIQAPCRLREREGARMVDLVEKKSEN